MPKRKAYSVQDKIAIIQRIRNGETRTKVIKETGVPESTLRGWLKDEDKLKDFCDAVDKKRTGQEKDQDCKRL